MTGKGKMNNADKSQESKADKHDYKKGVFSESPERFHERQMWAV